MNALQTVTIEYRPPLPEDLILRAAFADARSAEFDHLEEPLRSRLIDLQLTAQQVHYRAAYPSAVDRIIVSEGQSAGRLLVELGPVEWVLVDIAILREHRGRGVGSAVLAELCNDADAAGLAIRLRVLSREPSLSRWYGRFGFHREGTSGAHLVLVRPPHSERSLS